MSQPVLEVYDLSKTFAGQVALRDLDFELRAGEVHALLGHNGSGKSTFLKCLSGYHEPDPGGRVMVDGRPLIEPDDDHLGQHERARSSDLAFVHQDVGLVPTLTVMENLSFGIQRFETGRMFRIDWRREAEVARKVLGRLGYTDIDPRTLAGDLPAAKRIIVAIARCLYGSEQPRVIALDEPTAALAADDIERLFEAVREVAATGAGIIYVSHRLNEVLELCDRVTVLRDGERVATEEVSCIDEQQLVELVIGTSLEPPPVSDGTGVERTTVVRARGLWGGAVRGVDLELGRGEIVGLAGLVGAGRSDLGRLLMGAIEKEAGEIELRGEPVEFRGSWDAVRAGIALVPADRLREGAYLHLDLTDNLTLPWLDRFSRFGVVRDQKRREVAAELLAEYEVRPDQPDRRMDELSGGNQQKVVLARWLQPGIDVLILDEPSQGIDVGAKAAIHELLLAAAEAGKTLLVISEDHDELSRLCHRVVILRNGRIVHEVMGREKTNDRISELVFASNGAGS